MEVSTGTAEMPGAPSKQVSVDTQRRRRSSRRPTVGTGPTEVWPSRRQFLLDAQRAADSRCCAGRTGRVPIARLWTNERPLDS